MTRRFDGGRRSVLTGGGAAAALWFSGAGFASATALGAFSAFRQAVAESASDNAALATFYRESGYQGIWTGAGELDVQRRGTLLQALASAQDHGLPASRYDLAGLEHRMRAAASQRDLGEVEVALSRVFLRYAADIGTGMLTPGKLDAGLVLTVPLREPLELLQAFARANPGAFLHALPPGSAEYARLMKEKLRLEALMEAGGWGARVGASALKPAQTGADVIALRNRLISMGYLRRTATASYDAEIQKAVQAFQIDHGIMPDGVAGAGTLAEMNVPVEARLAAVLVAMERERWMNMPLGDRHIWVNIPDFTAQIRDNGSVTFATRSVVGATPADRHTPEFSDRMQVMVTNPTWNVPRSITVKEYLPMLKRNPYAAGHLKLIDRNGRVVDRGSVDFSGYTASNFPYAMKEPPSAGNALGLVKFLFPNKWNIYLHDTPTKALFNREVRAFSHGCIRLADPFDFAYEILSQQTSNPKALFKKYLDSRAESSIRVDPTVPVHLTYRTAFSTAKGRVVYRRDIYGRDAKVWGALTAAGVGTTLAQG